MKSKKQIYMCEAEGDAVYIQARSEQEAREILFSKMGDIPESLLTWSTVKELPEGAEFL